MRVIFNPKNEDLEKLMQTYLTRKAAVMQTAPGIVAAVVAAETFAGELGSTATIAVTAKEANTLQEHPDVSSRYGSLYVYDTPVTVEA